MLRAASKLPVDVALKRRARNATLLAQHDVAVTPDQVMGRIAVDAKERADPTVRRFGDLRPADPTSCAYARICAAASGLNPRTTSRSRGAAGTWRRTGELRRGTGRTTSPKNPGSPAFRD